MPPTPTPRYRRHLRSQRSAFERFGTLSQPCLQVTTIPPAAPGMPAIGVPAPGALPGASATAPTAGEQLAAHGIYCWTACAGWMVLVGISQSCVWQSNGRRLSSAACCTGRVLQCQSTSGIGYRGGGIGGIHQVDILSSYIGAVLRRHQHSRAYIQQTIFQAESFDPLTCGHVLRRRNVWRRRIPFRGGACVRRPGRRSGTGSGGRVEPRRH